MSLYRYVTFNICARRGVTTAIRDIIIIATATLTSRDALLSMALLRRDATRSPNGPVSRFKARAMITYSPWSVDRYEYDAASSRKSRSFFLRRSLSIVYGFYDFACARS